jgi:hypothetical protein
MLENAVTLAMLTHYEHLLANRPDFDGIKEPMSFFIPRFDAFVSLKEHVNGRDPKNLILSKYVSGDLLKYLRKLREFGFIGNYGGSVDLVRYVLRFNASNVNLVWIPKNSCTYLKLHYLQFEVEDTRQQIIKNQFHESCQTLFGIAHDELSNLTNESLAVIRHPVERFVSCYLDKFVKPVLTNKPFEDFVRNHIKLAQNLIRLPNIDIRRSLTFSEFLYYVSKQPQWSYDAHWRPQVQFLRHIPKLKIMTIDRFNSLYMNTNESNNIGANISFGKRFSLGDDLSGEYSDLLPSEIGMIRVDLYNQFVSKSHYLMLSDIYLEDIDLYEDVVKV